MAAPTKAVVLCAGYGTRLGALTQDCPKPLLPVADRPLVEHTLRHLQRHGFREVAINLHFRGEDFRAAFGDGASLGLQITYFDEPALLGTAGALVAMRAFLRGAETFLVQYGDVLTDEDLSIMHAFHQQTRADATLLLHRRPGSNSIVTLDESQRIVGFLERPSEEQRRQASSDWVNSGLCLAGPRFLDAIPDRVPCDIPRDVVAPSLTALRCFGYPLSAYRCAVDSPERYARADADVRGGQAFAQGPS